MNIRKICSPISQVMKAKYDHESVYWKNFPIKTLLITFFIFLSFSCNEDLDPRPTPDPLPEAIEYTGQLEQSSDDSVDFSDLEIISPHEVQNLADDGTFQIKSHEGEKYQLYYLTSKGTEDVMYFGLSKPLSAEIIANDSVTAIGLLLFNPSLLGIPQSYREQYVEKVTRHPEFGNLVRQIRIERKKQGEVSVDPDKSPQLAQIVIQIMQESLMSLEEGGRTLQEEYWSASIKVKDGPGNTIDFENWRHVYYGAHIDNRTTGEEKGILLNRIVKALYWKWQWWYPGFKSTKGRKTAVHVEDGNLAIGITKWNIKAIDDATVEGRATRYNTLLAAYYLIDMIMGAGDFKKSTADNLAISLAWGDAKLLYNADKGDYDFDATIDFTVGFLTLYGKPLIKAFVGGDNDKLLKISGKSWRRMFAAITAFGWLNEHIPFYVDLLRGPNERAWKYNHKNGVLTEVSRNLMPYAELHISPKIGYGRTPFTLSAAELEDDFTPNNSLDIRWKIGDQDWTSYSNNPDLEVQLEEPTRIGLQIKDEENDVLELWKDIPFYENIERTRIVALIPVWEDQYSTYLSNELGFDNSGILKHLITSRYESPENDVLKFDISILNPATDLLIFNPYVEGVQGLLDIWEENQLGLMNFVHQGGAILVILDDEALSSQHIEQAHRVLPLKIMVGDESKEQIIQYGEYSNDIYDFIGDAGEFHSGNGWYSKIALINHRNFYIFDESEGSIHLKNELDEPVLVEKLFGEGVMMGSITTPFFNEEDEKTLCSQSIIYLVSE